MDGLTLLREARSAGLNVTAEGERLTIRGPRRADRIARRLIAHKLQVLDALAAEALRDSTLGPNDLPGDWRVEWEERAAIMEHDGCVLRERAEALALTEILGRMVQAGEILRKI